MDKLFIICVDDQREVLSTLSEDLEIFENLLHIEECESADEAWSVMEEIDRKGDHVALVITDQVMPGNTGVDLLMKMNKHDHFSSSRKILLTGLATHQDTIIAINQAGLDHYIEKPWKKEDLHQVIKTQLTHFILKKGIPYEDFMEIIDQNTLYQTLRKST